MSSPSLLVFVLTAVHDDIRETGRSCHEDWKQTVPVQDAGRYRHTEQAVDRFFEHIKFDKGFVEGAEGDSFSWSFDGNYINADSFMESIEPFMIAVLKDHDYASATLFCQYQDCRATAWKFDRAGAGWRTVEGGLHDELPFSFEVEIGKIK